MCCYTGLLVPIVENQGKKAQRNWKLEIYEGL